VNVSDALLDRYGGHGPRYTSYPTVPHWTDEVGPPQYRRTLAELGGTDQAAELYVHVPFCARPCSFCGCHMFITRKDEPVERYLTTLQREAASVAAALVGRPRFRGLHLGGGTPTHLDVGRLGRLLDLLEEHFDFTPDAGRSLEVHPHVTSTAQLDLLHARGFRRLSLGVQDLTPEVQTALHRDQTAEETAALMRHARTLGFASLNVDLVYGLPRQTPEGLARTVRQVVAMGADRLAVYGYAHVPWLKPNQKGIREAELPSPAARRELYRTALDELSKEGFRTVGLDHFARPEDELFAAQRDGTLARGFMGYTVQRAAHLVGIGPSAIGDLCGVYVQNHADLGAWHAAIEAEGLATCRGRILGSEDLRRRTQIMSILCSMRLTGVDWSTHDRERRSLESLAADGLLEITADGIELTETGRYLARNVAMVFDPYLREESGDRPRYSRTV
jgi:oxygen-independent coproporphyrinogen-3 oxidase